MTTDAYESVVANGGEALIQEQSDRNPSPITITSSHDPVNAKDDFDGSYVFVSGTDDRDKDLVDSDLNNGETLHLPAENNDSVLLEEGESLVVVEQPDRNGVNDDKFEGGVEAYGSNGDCQTEKETIAVDQSEPSSHNGRVEAVEFINDLSTSDHKDEGETIVVVQSEQPAHNGEVEASTTDHKFENEKITIDQSEQPARSGDDHEIESETIAIVQSEQPAHSGDDHKIENETIAIDQSEQPVEISRDLPTPDQQIESETIENDKIVIDQTEQPVHNGDVEAVEIHTSASDHTETNVVDQSEQPAYNGDVEAVEISCDLPIADLKTESETLVVDQSEIPVHNDEGEVVEISNDLSTDHKAINETEVIVQSQPLAHNVEVEAEESNDDPRGEDVHDIKTEGEIVVVDPPEQSTYNGDMEAANDDKVEDKPDLVGATEQEATEQAEPFNEIPSGDSSGSPTDDLEQVQQDSSTATHNEAEIKDLPISNECCDVVPAAVHEQDGISEGVVVHENSAEENNPSDNEKPLSFSEEVPVEGSLGDNGVDLERSLETPSCSEVDQTAEIELSEGPLSGNNEEDLPAGLEQESISETVVITDLVDASQKTPEQTESVENAEGLTSYENIPDASVNKITENSDVENEASGHLSTCDVEEVRSETDNGKSNQESIEIIPNSSVNDVSFQPEIVSTSNVEEKVSTTDAIVVESENSNRTPECAGSQSISWAHSVENDSSLPVLGAAVVKPESEAENASAISERDMPADDVTAYEGKDTESGVVSNKILEHVDNDVNSTCQEVASIDSNQKDEASSLPEDSSEGQHVDVEVVKRPFYYLIRIPRFDDGDLREQIKDAQLQVEERTKSRDAFRAHIQTKRAALKDYSDKVQALLTEERAARDLFKSKRQEMDSALSDINKVKNALSVGDIDGRIRSMEHMIEHETLPLKEEKQFIREIKQLKQQREQLSSSMGTQNEIQQTIEQRDKIEDRLKVLKKELDQLRDKLNKAEEATQTAKKSFKDENEKLNSILSEYRAADDVRQDAYAHLQSLRKQQYEKNKIFWRYKDDAKAAQNLSLNKDKEQLQCLCLDQVERTMELWNNNDAFRREYVKWNTRSTLRRLRTSDGRALGPDEEPPVIPEIVNNRVNNNNHVKVASIPEVKQELLLKVETPDHKSSVPKVVERENRTAKTKAAKSTIIPAITFREDETKEKEKEKVEESRRTKEEEELARKEEELARKAEELRKEEAAAKLKQLRKLEEKAKAREAMDRKKKMAEKARVRAEIRAQKEAEEKEKERERRAKKKERKKANETDVTNLDEVESAPTSTSEVSAVITIESETKERSTTAAVKRPQKGSQFLKQSRAKSMPLPLRNRGKRRMQPWMWGALALVVVLLALFLVGIGGFSYRSFLQWFGL